MRQIDHNVATTEVWLWRDRHGRPQAHCDCGWTGPPRWFRWSATNDALVHPGHVTAFPIDRWKAIKPRTFVADLHAAFWLVSFIAIMAVALGYSVVPA